MYRILRCINWEAEPAKGLSRVMNGWQGARLKLCFIHGLWGQEEELLGRAGSWRRKIQNPRDKESSNLRIIKPHCHTSFWQLQLQVVAFYFYLATFSWVIFILYSSSNCITVISPFQCHSPNSPKSQYFILLHFKELVRKGFFFPTHTYFSFGMATHPHLFTV